MTKYKQGLYMNRNSTQIMALGFFVFAIFMIGMDKLEAETLSFGEVWRKVSGTSAVQEGARLKIQSIEEGRSRARNQWLPKIYMDARYYQTNDPSGVFFGRLEQRKIEAADFGPDSLNGPGTQAFVRGSLGLDLALYEGGSKQAQLGMYDHMAVAAKMDASQTEVEQYAESALAYGSIVLIRTQKEKLKKLNDEIAKLIKGYQLGRVSNPVGYSGLLGLRSLANRVSGFTEQLNARERSSCEALRAMGVDDISWIPESFDTRAFVDQYLLMPPEAKVSPSYKSQSGVERAQAAFQAARMEMARYRPRVGTFAESQVFNGSRDTATGYTAGLYLQWSLFDPSDRRKYQEAKLNSLAMEKFTQASIQQEDAELKGLAAAEGALRSTLAHLDDSDRLLSEQIRVSSTLFKNGSINALQFVEILNRRTDLISQQSEAEINLLKTAAEQVQRSRFGIPDKVKDGGRQ
jgi:hypothetical protein